jgi:2-C-methyl-D-erythritol 4-phosphate cytidylyltransferase
MMTYVAGRPLIAHTVDAMAPHVRLCVLVCREDQLEPLEAIGLEATLVPGGVTRTDSEMSGLAAVGIKADLIAIHDGARPCATPELIEGLFDAADDVGGAVPVVKPDRPLLDRSTLEGVEASYVQTPQVFRGPQLLAAYVKAAQAGFNGHDTAEIVSRYSNLDIAAVPGDPGNLKVTYPADLGRVREFLEDPSRTAPD